MNERRSPRISGFNYCGDGAYFITICTKNRYKCLSEVVGGDAHIAPHTALTQWGCIVETYLRSIPGIDVYVIMPNHVHMIVRIESKHGSMWASTPTQSMSDRIRSFKTLVTKQIGQSIWQRSYYDHVIRCQEDYICICEYINNNPAKWAEDEYYYAE